MRGGGEREALEKETFSLSLASSCSHVRTRTTFSSQRANESARQGYVLSVFTYINKNESIMEERNQYFIHRNMIGSAVPFDTKLT